MADPLLKEIDDALARDKMGNVWRQYGQQIVIGIALVVISLVALSIWKQQQHKALMAKSDILLKASVLLNEDPDNAAGVAEALSELEQTGAHAQLAALLEASAQANPQAALRKAQEMPDGNDLFAEFSCLQAYGFSDGKMPCQNLDPAFASIQTEYQLLHQLQAGDVAMTGQQLAVVGTPSDPMQQRRMDNLRAYINSSLAHLAEADDQPLTESELPADASATQTQP